MCMCSFYFVFRWGVPYCCSEFVGYWCHLGYEDERLGMPALCRAKDEWKGCLIIGGGAQVNKLAYRYLITETSSYKRLLVSACPCWAHNISNATKWRVGD